MYATKFLRTKHTLSVRLKNTAGLDVLGPAIYVEAQTPMSRTIAVLSTGTSNPYQCFSREPAQSLVRHVPIMGPELLPLPVPVSVESLHVGHCPQGLSTETNEKLFVREGGEGSTGGLYELNPLYDEGCITKVNDETFAHGCMHGCMFEG